MKNENNLAWERQGGESAKAFAAFIVYRDMGSKRSLREVGQKLGKSSALIERWAALWGWGERVAAFDAHVEAVAHAAEEEALKANARKWAKRAEAHREDKFADAAMLKEKARAMLAFPLIERTTSQDGKTVIIKPGRWNMGDAARMLDLADRLEALSVGAPTERHEMTGPDGVAVVPQQAESVVFYIPENGRDTCAGA